MSEAELQAFIDERVADQRMYSARNRAAVVAHGRERGIRLASHDDATPAHVEEALADGMVIAEFPTTIDAARASHQAGMSVLMGAPNVVRGKSHSGNVSARALGSLGVLDILSSDYVPGSLLYGALLLEVGGNGYHATPGDRHRDAQPGAGRRLGGSRGDCAGAARRSGALQADARRPDHSRCLARGREGGLIDRFRSSPRFRAADF